MNHICDWIKTAALCAVLGTLMALPCLIIEAVLDWAAR